MASLLLLCAGVALAAAVAPSASTSTSVGYYDEESGGEATASALEDRSPLAVGAVIPSDSEWVYRLTHVLPRTGIASSAFASGQSAAIASAGSAAAAAFLAPWVGRAVQRRLGRRYHGTGPASYSRQDRIGRGAAGEVWRAVRLSLDGRVQLPGSYILKRLHTARPAAMQSGWREVYFGLHASLRGRSGIARFVEHFRRCSAATHGSPPGEPGSSDNTPTGDGPPGDGSSGCAADEELWLVFHDEGVSLQNLLYATAVDRDPGSGGGQAPGDRPPSGNTLLQPSPLWVRLRTDPAGRELVRSLVRQLAAALDATHSSGIAHRDVKPANVLIGTGEGRFEVRLADFGSATDTHSATHLYGAGGPSVDEVTVAYASPESLLGTLGQATAGGREAKEGGDGGSGGGETTTGSPSKPWEAYDAFSLGVSLLEVVLGTPANQLFEPPPRTEALLRAHWSQGQQHGGPEGDGGSGGEDGGLHRALIAAGFQRLCIAPKGTRSVELGEVLMHGGPVPEEQHAHHHHHHSSRVQPEGVECGREGFNALLRAADALAQHRAVAMQRVALGRERTRVKRCSGEPDEDEGADCQLAPLLSADPATSLLSPSSPAEAGAHALAPAIAATGGAASSPLSPAMSVSLGGVDPHSGDKESFDLLALPYLEPPPGNTAPPPGNTALAVAGLRAEEALLADAAAAWLRTAGVVSSGPALPLPSPSSPRAGAGGGQAADDAAQGSDDAAAAAVGAEGADYRNPVCQWHIDARGSSTEHASAPSEASGDESPLSQPVPLLGADGEDLLFALLRWEPGERISLAAARRHPYLFKRGSGAREDEP